jgi:hypothetical protein
VAENANAEKDLASLDEKVGESISAAASQPTGASVADPAASAASTASPPSSAPEPAVTAAADAAPGGEKSDSDLLNEFEKMLSS